MKHYLLSLLFLFSFQFVSGQVVIQKDGLQEDFAILKSSLTQLHPGLYKYRDEPYLEKALDELQRSLDRDQSLREAYLAISAFMAKIQCGHTYVNPWNQNDQTRETLLDLPNKLPFTHEWLDGELIIHQNCSEAALPGGTRVLRINQFSTRQILQVLKQFAIADGGNPGQAIRKFHLDGIERYEPFDIYFPLLFPPQAGNTYELIVEKPGQQKPDTIKVSAISREARREILVDRYGPLPDNYDEFWEYEMLDDTTAYLKLGTFVTYKMKMDWKKYLRNAFFDFQKNGARSLIIDIRGNSGGTSEVTPELISYLISEPLEVPLPRSLVRYEKTPDSLNAYLQTWDKSFRDRSGKVTPVENGFFELKKGSGGTFGIKPQKNNFAGNVYLLVDATNSSATFTLAKVTKEQSIATLIGEPTGGNLRGINGGNMFFVNLPNSGIEFDLPLIGYYPEGDQPNSGIQPDHYVKKTREDLIKASDPVLKFALSKIQGP